MPPPPAQVDEAHLALMQQLDIAPIPRPFKSESWKQLRSRNKSVKQITGEATRKEAAALQTSSNSGAMTPSLAASTGVLTPVGNATTTTTNIAQAAQNLAGLVANGNGVPQVVPGMSYVTYSNIESAPSINPAQQRRYCDITGLPARYTDPKTKLRYHNKEVFGVLRSLPPGTPDQYLAARNGLVILK